jgi:hypothetical protein
MTKAPFRPKVAGRIAFFFGPLAGALISVINLRRFGYPVKAKRVFFWTLVGAAALAVIFLLIPDVLGRVVGLAAEIAFYQVYPRLQEKSLESGKPPIQTSSIKRMESDRMGLHRTYLVRWSSYRGCLSFIAIAPFRSLISQS